MEKHQMSHGYRRSGSCGMPSAVPYTMPVSSRESAMNSPRHCENNSSMYEHLDHLPLAMAYVPCQKFTTTFDTCHALKMGTIFPDLCKPFCGKRGMKRC